MKMDCSNSIERRDTPATLAEAEPITLARTTADEYCRVVRRCRLNEFWWYYIGLVPFRGASKPFQDRSGRWWWCVKPWFAWPVDFFMVHEGAGTVRPRRILLGCQYPVAESQANSLVQHNVILELPGYDLGHIQRKSRRHMVRRALRELRYDVGDPRDATLASEACEVWNSHVQRTGWNRAMTTRRFANTWAELAQMPGTTLITARDESCGRLCAWLIVRIIDDTMFIDTIASHSERLAKGPNDGLIFLSLWSAAKLGVAHAHYGLFSSLESLEAFKCSMGFAPHPFPCRLSLRSPVETLLRRFRPAIYQRLVGRVPCGDAQGVGGSTCEQPD